MEVAGCDWGRGKEEDGVGVEEAGDGWQEVGGLMVAGCERMSGDGRGGERDRFEWSLGCLWEGMWGLVGGVCFFGEAWEGVKSERKRITWKRERERESGRGDRERGSDDSIRCVHVCIHVH